MAEVIWSEPALSDLDAIADYIALENPQAAAQIVRAVFTHVEQLIEHPDSGSRPVELGRSRYRQIIEPPCRVFYRHDGRKVYILHVMRSEQLLRKSRLAARDKQGKIDQPRHGIRTPIARERLEQNHNTRLGYKPGHPVASDVKAGLPAQPTVIKPSRRDKP